MLDNGRRAYRNALSVFILLFVVFIAFAWAKTSGDKSKAAYEADVVAREFGTSSAQDSSASENR